MRDLTVHVEGRGYRGSWDTWQDDHDGRIVQARYRAWTAQGPVPRDVDAERMAEFLLAWCVDRALHGIHPGRGELRSS